MSLGAEDPLPRQTALFLDGEAAGAVTRFSHPPPPFLSHLPTALPFRLRPVERALVVGLGGGLGVMEALAGGAGEVEVTEVDQEVIDLLETDLASSSGNLLSHPAVTVRRGDGRLVLQQENAGGFDLIELAYLEGLGPAGAGVFAARESYLLTVEALRLCLSRLSPGGVLALAHWIRLPPRTTLVN